MLEGIAVLSTAFAIGVALFVRRGLIRRTHLQNSLFEFYDELVLQEGGKSKRRLFIPICYKYYRLCAKPLHKLEEFRFLHRTANTVLFASVVLKGAVMPSVNDIRVLAGLSGIAADRLAREAEKRAAEEEAEAVVNGNGETPPDSGP